MSDEQKIDYEAVLNDLENDRAELDIMIEHIKRKKLGQTVTASQTTGIEGRSRTIQPPTARLGMTGNAPVIRSDAFFGLSLVEATKKYLAMVKRPKSSREIATALVEGGFKTTAKEFYNTVFGVLNREAQKNGGEVVKVQKEWGLAEWYPGLRRKRMEVVEEYQGPYHDHVVKLKPTEEPSVDPFEDETKEPSSPTVSERPFGQSRGAS